MVLADVGEEGQRRLKASSVLLVGTGALGSPAALYLAAAGVGRLVLVDGDTLDASNLHRQVLHDTAAIGSLKVDSAAERLRALNPEIEIETHAVRLSPGNAQDISRGCDLIVDGCDNFPTRFLTNDLGFFSRIPVVHGAIDRFQGQLSVFSPGTGGPCYRCLLPALPAPGTVPSCEEAGVLGALPGSIGSLMAMEALKLLIGFGDPMIGRLFVLDVRHGHARSIRLQPDPRCPLCGPSPTIHSLTNSETMSSASCSTDSGDSITAEELSSLLVAGFDGMLVDVREPHEHEARRIETAVLIPLRELDSRLAELPVDRRIILHCKSGMRSARALALLKSQGYRNVRHLEGGIDAWPPGSRP